MVAVPSAASALAAECNIEVEVEGARTEYASTFALPDGSMRLDVSTVAVRTDVSGEWEPVDSSLEDFGGAVTVASPVAPMAFSDGSGDEPFATIERDGHTLTFDVPFDLPAPDVDESRLTYPDVLPEVDLVVTVNEDATGFSEVLRVESPEAARHPLLADLTFPVTTSDGIDVQAQDGGFVAADASGEPVFTSPVPAMWDSSSDAPDDGVDRALGDLDRADPTVAPVGDEAVAAIPAAVTEDGVTVTPNAAMLTDPGTEWPVYIDPSVSASLHQRSAVRTVIGNAYNFAGDEGVGLCSRATSTTCSHTFQSRLLYQFVDLGLVGGLEPGEVRRATFAVTGTHSYDCTPRPVTLHAVADFSASTPYPGGSYWKPLQTHTIAHRSGCTNGQVPRRIEFDATVAAQDVAAANQGHASFGIAVDESSMAYWKRYGWDASLTVEYNRAPSAPTDLRTTWPDGACHRGDGRAWLRERTPHLRARLADADGTNVLADVVLTDMATRAQLWRPSGLLAQASGSDQELNVPPGLLQDGHVYEWSVRGVDTEDRNLTGPWGTCEFGVDLTPPAEPLVTAVEGRPVVYREDATAGGIGQPGLFRLDANGSTDVVRYHYSLNDSGLNLQAPVGTPTVIVRPRTDGTHTLHVQAVDRAGNTSPVRTYRFTVDTAALSSGWPLDETAPGTAADVVAAPPNPLTVSASTAVVPGLEAELGTRAADRALRFDDPADTATSARPAVAGLGPFSVSALVRLDDTTATATAVSQDGQRVSGFELGHRVDPACPSGTGSCWAFTMRTADADGAAPVTVMSPRAPRAGAWAQLTGVRGADGRLRLHVCDLSTPRVTSSLTIHSATGQAASTPWLATGALQVGRGKAGGAPVHHLRGAVGDVRTYTGEVSVPQLRLACQNPGGMPVAPAPQPLPGPVDDATGPVAEVYTYETWKQPWSPTLYRIVSGAPRAVSYEDWMLAGFPAPRPSVTEYVKYRWSPSVYAVTRWSPTSTTTELLSYEQWHAAGFPGVREVAWVDGSDVHQRAGSPEIWVRDPAGDEHLLTYAEWEAMGLRAPRVEP